MSLPPSTRTDQLLRFSVFEVDLAAGELRKNGIKIRLQEQPFQILAFLLGRPGELVTRQDLRDKLWSNDTFVDFDHSLNTAINKLREALGDSASSPRFIETVARRGYRFLAAVRWEKDVTHAAGAAAEPAPPELPKPHRSAIRGLFGLIQIMYLVFYIEALIHWQGIERVSWTAAHRVVFVCIVLISASIGIPVRLYLISAGAFDYSRLGEKFHRIFPGLFALDELWAVVPFLIVDRIGLGAALGATAALLYVPFAERTLVRMAYRLPLTSSPRSRGQGCRGR